MRERADQQWWSLRSGSSRSEFALSRLVIRPGKIDSPLPEEGVKNLQALLEATDAMVPTHAEGPMLVLEVAGANPQHHPPTTNLPDRVDHLGQQGGVAVAHAADQRAECDPFRGGGESGQERPAFPVPDGVGRCQFWRDVGAVLRSGCRQSNEQVINQPERVEARCLGLPGETKQV